MFAISFIHLFNLAYLIKILVYIKLVLLGRETTTIIITLDPSLSKLKTVKKKYSWQSFFTVWPPNPSQRKLKDVHWQIISQWNIWYVCFEMGFLRLACTCEETSQCVLPPNANLYSSSTCAHLQLLAGPFDQGFTQAATLCYLDRLSVYVRFRVLLNFHCFLTYFSQ